MMEFLRCEEKFCLKNQKQWIDLYQKQTNNKYASYFCLVLSNIVYARLKRSGSFPIANQRESFISWLLVKSNDSVKMSNTCHIEVDYIRQVYFVIKLFQKFKNKKLHVHFEPKWNMDGKVYKAVYIWSSGSWDSQWYFYKWGIFFPLKHTVSMKSSKWRHLGRLVVVILSHHLVPFNAHYVSGRVNIAIRTIFTSDLFSLIS